MTAQTQLSFHSVDNGDGGATIKDEHGGYVASVQWAGHAPLLAAAPDLLAALKRIAFEGDYCPTDEELEGEDADHFHQLLGRWDAGETARKAIAKATDSLALPHLT